VERVVIRRVLVANRAEIAVRVMRACRELDIESVAVYSDVDANAAHVALADRAVPLGGTTATDSYLSIPKVIAAAKASGADAVHPGYGFLSQSPALASACEAAGLAFVGPPSQVMARMGSKVEARRAMEGAGVPVVPGATPEDQSDAALVRAAHAVGLPVLVKASAGGGGKGMRRVTAAGDLEASIQAARREATAAFGDGTLYIERLIDRPHHIEVQVFADAHGHVIHLFERECSVQRRHQKVVEESPSPNVTGVLRGRITAAAVLAARASGYRNAGTVEFLVDCSRGPHDDAPFYFLEMNTRLQVEHGVTEQVVGVDLVRAQLLVAAGEPLPWTSHALAQRGHAIEARIYAEDPAQGFLPQAGRLLLYREPRMPGVRIDSGVREGDDVSVHYDPLLAKVVATAETRALAVARLSAALRDFPILGVHTNLPFLLDVLAHPAFVAGTIDTSFLDVHGVDEARHHGEVPPCVQAAMTMARSEGGQATAGVSAGVRIEWDPWNGLQGWQH
jgi:acetyl/propionyl-CoA carboxylase alpha subunit